MSSLKIRESKLLNPSILKNMDDNFNFYVIGEFIDGKYKARAGMFNDRSDFIYCKPGRKRKKIRFKDREITEKILNDRSIEVIEEKSDGYCCFIDRCPRTRISIYVPPGISQGMVEFLKTRAEYEL